MAAAVAVEAQGYTFHVSSVAGVESCCYVDSLDLAFDLGCLFGKVVTKTHVFITHGHVDHIQAFVAHAARRALWQMKPANYYVPAHLVPHMRELLDSTAAMQEDAPFAANIVPLEPFEQVKLPNNVLVQAIPTSHRVPSLGYIVYKVKRQLKSELFGMGHKAVAELRRQGVQVTQDAAIPEIAYTGDTTAEVFHSSVRAAATGDTEAEHAMRDLLRVKVLITEVRSTHPRRRDCCVRAVADLPAMGSCAFTPTSAGHLR